MVVLVCLFFFFKQKTAYEMRISDWSSDVCSSDLAASRACPCRHPYPGTVNHPCVFSVREERSSPAKVACAPLARHSETTEHCARRRRASCRVQRIHSRVPGNCGPAHSVRLRLGLPSVAEPPVCGPKGCG